MTRVVKEPEERRNELIDIAEALFIEKGYEHTTVEEIIKKAKIAKGTFYYYFKSKSEILDAVLDRYINEISEFMLDIQLVEELNAVEKMIKIFRYFSQYRNNRHRFIGYIHEERNAHLHLKVEKKFVPVFVHSFASIVKQGVEEGLFCTNYPVEAALAVLTLGVQFGNSPDSYFNANNAERNTEAFLDIFERVLGAEPGIFLKIEGGST